MEDHEAIILELYDSGKHEELIARYIHNQVEGVHVGIVRGRSGTKLHYMINNVRKTY
jgi:hypothetical protein